jgi:outer membrane protein assembly factor BamB
MNHHHHVEKQPDGTYVMLRHQETSDPESLIDRIVRYSANHAVVWSWDPLDHLAVPDPPPNDWLHANAVTVTDSHVYLSCRNRDQILVLDADSGALQETIGRGGDYILGTGDWFIGQHDPELQPDGSWMIYDNRGAGLHSRVIQLVLDPATETAGIAWSFPGASVQADPWYTEDWYSSIWGDADVLSNGNVLVAAGTRDEGRESRVFEVDPTTNDVVWSIRWPESPGIVGVYRADRIPVPLEAVPQ